MYKQLSAIPAKMLLVLALATLVPLIANSAHAKKVSGAERKQSASQEPAATMYRYVNDQGITVTSSSITPEYARKGYQLVTITGTVVQTIPPEPTAEERALIAKDADSKISAAQQREQDKQLLLRYSTLDEIQFAKNRKLTEIDNKIILLNSNVGTLKSQIDVEQQRAAGHERNGQPVPAALLKKIDDLQKELKITEGQVTSRQQEMADETIRFDKDIERLTFLEKNRPKR